MKKFKDLEFKTREGFEILDGGEQARMNFSNGYGVSVLFGDTWYSNGVDTYELGVTRGKALVYPFEGYEDVHGYLYSDEVTELMIRVQELEKI